MHWLERLQPDLMYSWAHSDTVVKHVQVLPGKLPSLDWLLKSDSFNADEKNEIVQQKGATTLLALFL